MHGGQLMTNILSPITQIVKDRLQDLDDQMGGLQDNHLKWIRGYVYYQLNTKLVQFYFDNCSRPRRLLVLPFMPNGQVMNRFNWLRFKWRMVVQFSKKQPLLHPYFWPTHMGLKDTTIQFIRTKPKETV